jgi:hypothetical protein
MNIKLSGEEFLGFNPMFSWRCYLERNWVGREWMARQRRSMRRDGVGGGG